MKSESALIKISLFIFIVITISQGVVRGSTSPVEKNLKLPPDFWWGTSLAAYQSEGGNTNSWTQWEASGGHIKNGDHSGLAADHWNLFEKDFDNLVWLHANTHRLSLEWSRLEPSRGHWNKEVEAHYRQMILALKARHIRPVICLFHFTLPIWAAELGGFENKEVVKDFIAFAMHAQRSFGDLVTDWLTVNEPVVYALAAYGAGVTPPGVKDLRRAARVVANLMHAHGLIYQNLKKLNSKNSVSFAHHLRAFAPLRWYNPLDQIVTHYADQFVNWAWYDSLTSGRITLALPFQVDVDEPCPECRGALDYIGFNYYSRDILSFDLFGEGYVKVATSDDGPKTDLGWEIYPQGLAEILTQFKKRGLQKYPILLTENGLADDQDLKRSQFIYDHLYVLLSEGRRLGLEIKGYLHWSLIDNFEWLEGFTPRFGLFKVDYKTLERTPRNSAYYFRQIGMTHELVPPPVRSPVH